MAITAFRRPLMVKLIALAITPIGSSAFAEPVRPPSSVPVVEQLVFVRGAAGPLRPDTKVTRPRLEKLFPGYQVVPVSYEDEGGTIHGFEVRRKSKRVLFIHVEGTAIVRVGAYEPEVASELGVRVGESLGTIRSKVPNVSCDVDALYGDGILCFSPTVSNVHFRFDADEKSSRMVMMEWVPKGGPGDPVP